MTIKQEHPMAGPRGPRLMAAGGLVGALAASSCCILPLVLFSLGVSGAWIGNLTQLAPYQPFFIARLLPASVTGTGSPTGHQELRVLAVKRVRGRCRSASSRSGSSWRRCSSSRQSASTSWRLCSSTHERSTPHDGDRTSESDADSGQRRCGTTRFVVLWWVAHIRIYWAGSLFFDLGTITFRSAGVGGGRSFRCCDQLSLLSSDGRKGERQACRVAAENVHQHSHRACGHGW